MIIREALHWGILELKSERTPFLDALVLLGFTLGLEKEKLLSSYPEIIHDSDFLLFKECIRKREAGFPVSYITQNKEFYALNFYVDENVLIPRPDTEILVEKALELCEKSPVTDVLDLCTGSGCIAVSLKKNQAKLQICASDISKKALNVAEINARNNDVSIKFINSDLFNDIHDSFDLIVTNPPYISETEYGRMLKERCREPGLALVSGSEGLDLIQKIIVQAKHYLKPSGVIILEAGYTQLEKIADILKENAYINIRIFQDIEQRNRIVMAEKG